MSRCRLFALGALIAAAFATSAAADPPTPAEKLKAIRKDVADADTAFRDAWAKLPDPHQDDPHVEELYKRFDEKQKAGFIAALEIAKADPKSDTAFDALEWLLMTPRAYYFPPGVGKAAFELLATHHVANPKIGRGIATLAYVPPHETDEPYREALSLLKGVAEKNPDKAARGQAALGLAWLAKRSFVKAESKGDPSADQLASEAEKAMETVIRDYGDCENLRTMGAVKARTRPTLKDEVKLELYELRNLRIGKPAPEIVGEDLAGTKFKLSDHRGKVVLLVFWASWCGPCMGAVPHERELVEKFKDRPFVLVGVNGDEEKDAAAKAVERAKIPWRSFWNGKEGASGPIATAWNIRGWPTVYVIDHKGIIRHKYLHGNKLDEPLEKMIAAAEESGR
jgi:thiol-disulfide isomerase/thioredoxin